MVEILESAESASPLITRHVAGSLKRQEIDGLSLSQLERFGLRLLQPLPASFARELAAWRVARGAIPPRRLIQIRTEELVSARLDDYAGLAGKYDLIFFGSALGGAAAHLAAVAGGPFLPQPFILGVQGGTKDDRLETYLEHVTPIAETILSENPDLAAIAHFDPVHDGWLTRRLAHLRLKLIDLPSSYKDFILAKLKPGGAIVYLDCSARWLQYRLNDRVSLQVGGWGDIPAQEFLVGSERINSFLSRQGSQHTGGWELRGQSPDWCSESEWGSQPGLDLALESFAGREGFRFERIRFGHPHDFSRLAFLAHRELFLEQGIEARGVLIEMFTQYAPWLAIERGLLPLWLIFNTHDSLLFLQRERSSFPEDIPVYLSALVTLSRTPDMVEWDEWAVALAGRDWHSVGARREKYPEDLLTLGTWTDRLRNLTSPLDRLPGYLSLERLLGLTAKLQGTN
jgi:hypothetical protein